MNEDMQSNPDYQLVMKFLQSIRPGDMDDESAQQLIAIGQRIQNGGVLSDREREMLNSVVRAMPQIPEGSASSDANCQKEPKGTTRTMPPISHCQALDGMTYGPSSGVSSSLALLTQIAPAHGQKT
jgi:hypothetical protein